MDFRRTSVDAKKVAEDIEKRKKDAQKELNEINREEQSLYSDRLILDKLSRELHGGTTEGKESMDQALKNAEKAANQRAEILREQKQSCLELYEHLSSMSREVRIMTENQQSNIVRMIRTFANGMLIQLKESYDKLAAQTVSFQEISQVVTYLQEAYVKKIEYAVIDIRELLESLRKDIEQEIKRVHPSLFSSYSSNPKNIKQLLSIELSDTDSLNKIRDGFRKVGLAAREDQEFLAKTRDDTQRTREDANRKTKENIEKMKKSGFRIKL